MIKTAKVGCFALLAVLAGETLAASPPSLQWMRQLEDADRDIGIGIWPDEAGNVLVASSSGGASVDGISPLTSIFLTTIDSFGTAYASQQLGVSADDFHSGAVVDELGDVYVGGMAAGQRSKDALVGKFSPAGQTLWKTQLKSPQNDFSVTPALNDIGDVFIAGGTNGTLGEVSAGSTDAFVSRFDRAGNLKWKRQFGTSAFDQANAVAADAFGNVFVTGPTEGNISGPPGYPDALLAKFNSSGEMLWSAQFGTTAGEWPLGASTDTDGNVYVTGQTFGALGGPLNGSSDIFLSKFSASGTKQWTMQLGSSGLDVPRSLVSDPFGNLLIAGYTNGSFGGANAGGTDALVIKVDASGELVWTKQFGTAAYDEIHAISADGLGNIYAAGGIFYVDSIPDTLVAKLVEVPEPPATMLASAVLSVAAFRYRRCGR